MRYFVQNPSAADSLEGIARWRLLRQRVRDVVDETDVALQILVERGVVDRLTVTGGPALFRLKPEKESEARQMAEDRP